VHAASFALKQYHALSAEVFELLFSATQYSALSDETYSGEMIIGDNPTFWEFVCLNVTMRVNSFAAMKQFVLLVNSGNQVFTAAAGYCHGCANPSAYALSGRCFLSSSFFSLAKTHFLGHGSFRCFLCS
jgi:hypothetical protein